MGRPKKSRPGPTVPPLGPFLKAVTPQEEADIVLAYGRLLDTADGKVVLGDLFRRFVYTPSVDESNPDINTTHINEGKRLLVLELQLRREQADQIMNAPPAEAGEDYQV